jgi:phosphonoacetaldehyde hydrolase
MTWGSTVALEAARPYRGPVKAVILDWAGTIVDYGSCAPASAFVALFSQRGISITVEEARRPMGSHKRDHVSQLLALPRVASAWRELHGRDPADEDVDLLYRDLIPLQTNTIQQHTELIPGAIEAVAAMRARGIKIGSDTGYNREMMAVLAAAAGERGFEPDAIVTADDVPAGRPYPWMALQNMIELEVFPAESCVKVGDTVPDVLEGLNAGMWSVAVAKTGNELGLSAAEVAELPADELRTRLQVAGTSLREAGAHYVVDAISDVPAVLTDIESRLAAGKGP